MTLNRLSQHLRHLPRHTRPFAAISSNFPPPSLNTVGPYQVFDRNAKRMQRDRAAARNQGAQSRVVDYVRDEVAERMMERFLVCHFGNKSDFVLNPFEDIKRKFDTVVDLGSGPGHFSRLLEPEKVKKSIMIDSSGKQDLSMWSLPSLDARRQNSL